MRVLVLALLLATAGCFKPADPPTPTQTVAPGNAFLVDPVDPELKAVYDLLDANFTELNGSVVLSVHMRDVFNEVPRVLNVFDVIAEGERRSYFARIIPDLNRPPPHINYELGRLVDGREEVLGTICGIHGAAEKPPRILFDLPHDMTGLVGGGSIVRLHIEVRSFQEERLLDVGDAEKTFPVRGGNNPHETCALVAERPQRN
jgi:hypothetical protein